MAAGLGREEVVKMLLRHNNKGINAVAKLGVSDTPEFDRLN